MNTLLIIDGSYFSKSIRESKAFGSNRIEYDRLLSCLRRQIGADFTHMYWIDSVRDDGPDSNHQHFIKVC